MVLTPDRREEQAQWGQGYLRVAGVDEVGRGPLAGPVMAAAVILPWNWAPTWLKQIRDSKLLTPARRAKLAAHLHNAKVSLGIGSAEHEEIDEMGIVPATRLAMARAIAQLSPPPNFLLIDALNLPEIPIPQKAIVHGDALCLSIAAASIVAKLARDRRMEELDTRYPGYGFARHKGYPTRLHVEQLRRLGPSPVHRRYFQPVRQLLEASRG